MDKKMSDKEVKECTHLINTGYCNLDNGKNLNLFIDLTPDDSGAYRQCEIAAHMDLLPEDKPSDLCPHYAVMKCACGATDDLIFASDPYNHAVHGDDTEIWQCMSCYTQTGEDI